MTEQRSRDWSISPFGGDRPLFLIAGPCVIESEGHARMMAERVAKIAADAGVPFVFKASFDKANRSSVNAFRGPGLKEGLRILGKIKEDLKLTILTDIHDASQAAPAAEVVDILQIPTQTCCLAHITTQLACLERGIPVDLPDPATVGYGFDFNPVADRVRVVTGSLNFRIDPNSGAPIDGNLNLGTLAGINPDGSINGGTASAPQCRADDIEAKWEKAAYPGRL